jgi:hypothetical protein
MGGMAGMGGMGAKGMGGGAMGAMGGMSGMGGMVPGGFGGALGAMGGLAALGGNPEASFTPQLVMAVVEVQGKTNGYVGGLKLVKIHHKWGTSYVVPKTSDQRLVASIAKIPTIEQKYDKELKTLDKKDGKPTPEGLLKLAEWALNHGLQEKFVQNMEQLASLKPTEPEAAAAVEAFGKVQTAIKAAITKPDSAETWKKYLGDKARVVRSDHYALIHNLEGSGASESPPVKSRLDRLERNYRDFFYWFTLKGKALTVPDERLVAVLVASKDDFRREGQIFDLGALADHPEGLVADGFLARRENLAVFSLQRIDPASDALDKNTVTLWAELDRNSVLHNKFPTARKFNEYRQNPFLRAEVETIALLQRALEEDSEIATVTHEGTRQLLAATGLMPRNVAAPQWDQFGLASFFDSPKGSPWVTVGTPSATVMDPYNYLAHYKAAADAKKLDTPPAKALEKVVTDEYFREAAAAVPKDKKGNRETPKEVNARIRARSMAWALTYFLAQKRLDGLIRYQHDLAKLPRDMEFDKDILLLTFARAFDLVNPARPQEVDQAKLARLADDWHSYIITLPLEAKQLLDEAKKNQDELKAVPEGNQPAGQPGRPGGAPGAPGILPPRGQ